MVLLATPRVSAQAPPSNLGSLTVEVQYRSVGGAPPGPLVAQQVLPTPPTPAAGVEVQAVPAGAPAAAAVATAMTGDTGHAILMLPGGTYTIYVPVAPSTSSGLAGMTSQQLPDGTLVQAMATAEVTPGANSAVTITLVVQLP